MNQTYIVSVYSNMEMVMPEQYELIRILTDIKDPEVMEKFLDELLTESERHDLILRWKLMKMLEKGMTQRKIASELKVSLCKITRGAKIIKDKNSATRQLMNRKQKSTF